jgi:uncharacterized protein YjbI with pentapeptide repeats
MEEPVRKADPDVRGAGREPDGDRRLARHRRSGE